jgi:AAA family ATP:ADP antiporter
MSTDPAGNLTFIASVRSRVASRFGHDSDEVLLAALAFGYFFLLLCGYFIIRPVRDSMAVEYGAARLPNLFIIIFLTMLIAVPLYGWVVSRFPKGRIVPICYGFFALNILAFYAMMVISIDPMWIASCFFVWVSVYNLFVVSIFWSFMVDVFTPDQAKRLFGTVSAGGTLGALIGPLITSRIAHHVGTANLLPISFVFLIGATICVHAINRVVCRMPMRAPPGHRIGHGAFSGFKRVLSSRYLLTIAIWVFLQDLLSTVLYLQQQSVVAQSMTNPEDRVHLFALMDFSVSVITILLQLSVAAKIISLFGLGFAMAAVPAFSIFAFIGVACWPVLPVIVVCQVVGRGLGFGLANPARHILFSTVSLDEKYKAQNVVDTLVERCGDAAGGTAFAALLSGAGLGLAAIALLMTPVAALWVAASIGLGVARKNHLSDP